ncbi:MAG TPA: HigA family addiction module antitoxin [Hanamia sp.]|jgi:antitoxin HigA-1|nr:HigA family addiction module antitoxin [Hanamia sp.]
MKRGIRHNTHPGELLKEEILKANNLSVTEAASMLGVTRAALSNVINEKAAISPLMALRITKVFGGSAEFWVRMQAAHDLRNAEIEITKRKLRLKPYKYNVV